MKLFCWIIGESSSPFAVNLKNDDTVYDLKKEIIKEKPHALDGIDAD
jgi:hypothetical protein